jgi:glycosyltransferase involved in cell wall biosynthesis
MSRPPLISACIVCRNEADKLEACLASATWVDEIVVLDLESTDGSADVARTYGARVLVHAPVPVVEAVRNVVADAASGEWVLALDPDERVSSGLAHELRRIAGDESVDAVEIPFMNYDFGYPASHPMHRFDPKPRFYRRARVRWPEMPNALPRIERGRVLRLPDRSDLVMVHERNRTVAEAIERVLRYAPAQGQAMVDRGDEFSARSMLRALGNKAYREFVVGRPWRDGVPGFFRAGVLLTFHFYVWASFWQASATGRTAADDQAMHRIGMLVETVRLPARIVRRLVGRGQRAGGA